MKLLAVTPLGRNRDKSRLWIETRRLEALGFPPGTPFTVEARGDELVLRPSILAENHVSSRRTATGLRPIIDVANQAYLGPLADTEIHWAMMQSLSQSLANMVLFPLQDVLGLDGAHRMNTPGVAQGCWEWRFDWSQVPEAAARRLAELTRAHGRNGPD